MNSYAPLHLWLMKSNSKSISMTFQQIEDIIGRTLPYSARSYSAWWSNNSHRHVHAHAWLDAGYHTRDVSAVQGTVTFTRN